MSLDAPVALGRDLLGAVDGWIAPLPLASIALALALALACAGRRRPASLVAGTALASVLALATPRVGDALVAPLEDYARACAARPPPPGTPIVVLGGAADVSPAPGRAVELGAHGDRLAVARRLWARDPSATVVLSGGPTDGSGSSEARRMAALLIEWGVPAASLELEERSLDTRANARRVAGRLGGDGRSIALVTSAFHMRRAAALFRAAGFDVAPVPADHLVHAPGARRGGWVPSASALSMSARALRERLATLALRAGGALSAGDLLAPDCRS